MIQTCGRVDGEIPASARLHFSRRLAELAASVGADESQARNEAASVVEATGAGLGSRLKRRRNV